MSSITEPALDFAKNHIRCFYASDFFPDPDEFDAVWFGWDKVVSHYKGVEVARLGTTPEDMACAKAIGGFRVVHQLQPLDAITYTALTSLIAPHLEAKRIPEGEGVACSYRIDVSPSGRLFKTNADGYATFRSRSKELSELYDWVFLADIAGFYNHVYVHRVQGAVELLDRSLSSVASELHEFLLNLNDRVSIGIPVGPAASVVVAELILNEIDHFIVTHRTRPNYTRYVDDYRFFSNSHSDLEELWHDLSSFLYRAHRLTLANGKTCILSSSQFHDDILFPKVNVRRSELARDLGLSFADLENQYTSLGTSPHSDPTTFRGKATALERLFSELLADEELNIGLARQLLRRARALRMRSIVGPVARNLEKVAPVIRDAGLYLQRVMNRPSLSLNSAAFERFFGANPLFVRASHLHYWLAWLLSEKPGAIEVPGCEEFFNFALPRFQARLARTLNRASWVRDNRSEWQKWATWDRWALLNAAEMLSARERRAWMDSVAKSNDLMDRLVASRVRAL